MPEDPKKERLEALDTRIKALKETQAPEARADEHYSQAHIAWRMVIELVAGLALGFGIGWGLDWLFGTRPIFLVLFIMIGLAAGVNVMLRTAKEVGEDQAAHAARRKKKD
ncbi:MAG: AtpZ/AtpI family protein [Paracoccaceae bacterium]